MTVNTSPSKPMASPQLADIASYIEPRQLNGVLTSAANQIHFTIHGKVIGKGRPHFVRKTGVAITPPATRSYESVVRDYAMREMGGREPWTFPVLAVLVATYEIPKSWAKGKKEQALRQLFAPAKPDVDNVVKIVLDACNRTVYIDDTQVTQCLVFKRFGEAAKLDVLFREASDLTHLCVGETLDVQFA